MQPEVLGWSSSQPHFKISRNHTVDQLWIIFPVNLVTRVRLKIRYQFHPFQCLSLFSLFRLPFGRHPTPNSIHKSSTAVWWKQDPALHGRWGFWFPEEFVNGPIIIVIIITITLIKKKSNVYIYILLYIYVTVDLNSLICKRPFFVNKERTFANLSRTPCLSFGRVSCSNMLLALSPKKYTFANSGKKKKNIRGVSCWNPGGLCNGQSLHGPLDRQSYEHYMYIPYTNI